MPTEVVGIHFPAGAEGFDPRVGSTHCRQWQMLPNSSQKECKLSQMVCTKEAQSMA